jgi:hypothetical protein
MTLTFRDIIVVVGILAEFYVIILLFSTLKNF